MHLKKNMDRLVTLRLLLEFEIKNLSRNIATDTRYCTDFFPIKS
jgi:hypothetical protein